MRYDRCCGNQCCRPECPPFPVCPPCPSCPDCPPCPSVFAVVYNPNGGFSGIADFDQLSRTLYVVKTLAEAGITRPGYVFDSWNTQPSGTGATYYPGDVITLTQNHILYAQWIPRPD